MSLSIERVEHGRAGGGRVARASPSGAIAPGTPMRMVDLSVRAGVSRTTVREVPVRPGT